MTSLFPGSWLTTTVHVAAFLLVTLHVLSKRREPGSALLWIFVAWLVPLLGPLTYLAFGVNRAAEKGWEKQRHDDILFGARRQREEQGQSLSGWRRTRLRAATEPTPPFDPVHRALNALLPDHPLLAGNAIEPLITGDEAIPAMFTAVRNARHHVHLQSFIVGLDAVGRELMELLAEKAREGVRVRLLFDRFGSTAATFGGLFRRYRGIEGLGIVGWTQASPLKRHYQVNLRNHRKVAVIDGNEAFCGGVNLSQSNRTKGPHPAIQDYHFRLRGPIVHELQYGFMRDWHFITPANPEDLLQETYFPPLESEGRVSCRLLSSDPGVEFGVGWDALFQTLTLAEKQILAVTPYFVPPFDVHRAFRAAALRGVDVRLVVPQRNNHWFAGMASRAFYQELLEAGVRIFHRPPPFMHAKALIVDGRFVIVGSGNIDVRSLRLNYETNLVVCDEGFADEMKAVALNEIAVSQEVLLPEWRSRPFPHRFAENFLALMSPVL